MKRRFGPALKAAVLSALIVLAAVSTAFGQRRSQVSVGDYYGTGADGTIGRGTLILPGGPSDWKRSGLRPGGVVPASTSSGGSPARPARPVATPYLTTRTYEPGDGYRYPLYYNPARGTYFYYPVGRR